MFNHFADGLEANIDMFSPHVESDVGAEPDGRLVITKECGRFVGEGRNKFANQFSAPKNLFGSMVQGNVFGFSCRLSDQVLLLGGPRDNAFAEEKYVPTDGFAIQI